MKINAIISAVTGWLLTIIYHLITLNVWKNTRAILFLGNALIVLFGIQLFLFVMFTIKDVIINVIERK